MSEEVRPPQDTPRIEEATEDWFADNLKWIALGTVAVVLACVGVVWWLHEEESERIASLQAADTATTAGEWMEVVENYPETPGAVVAGLRAADEAEKEGRFDEAADFYRQVIAMEPDGPFADAAELAEATCLEAAGRMDEALAGYEAIYTQRPDHPFRGGAVLGMARIESAQGNAMAARELLADYLAGQSQVPGQPTDPFVMRCRQLMQQLPKTELQSPPTAPEG